MLSRLGTEVLNAPIFVDGPIRKVATIFVDGGSIFCALAYRLVIHGYILYIS